MIKKKIKSIISMILVINFLVYPIYNSLVEVKASTEEFVTEDGTLVSYNGNDSNIVIPENVTAIGAGAFAGCETLTTVTFPESVISIKERAFYNCKKLIKIEFSKQLKNIEKWAFYGCSSLEHVDIPEGTESIGALAFYNCNNLQEIIIPKSVLAIGSSAIPTDAKVIIYGYKGSVAEEYANNNGIEFSEIDGEEDDKEEEKNQSVSNDIEDDTAVTGKSIIKTCKQTSWFSAELTYAKYKGAQGYKIDYAMNSKFTKNKKTIYTTKLKYTLNNLTRGKTYYVKICAYKTVNQNNKKKKKTIGKYSNVKKIKMTKTYRTQDIKLKQTGKKVEVQFEQVGTATGYIVTYSTAASFKSAKSKYVKDTTCVLSGVTEGKVYYIKVRGYKNKKSNYVSDYSKISKIALVSLDENKIKSVKQVANEKIEVTFYKVLGVDGYEITCATDENMSADVKKYHESDDGKNSATQSIIIDNAEPKKTYYFMVKSYKKNGEQDLEYLGNPSAIQYIVTAQNVMRTMFSWDKFSFENPKIKHCLYLNGAYYQAFYESLANQKDQVKQIDDLNCLTPYNDNNKDLGAKPTCFGMSAVLVLSKAGKLSTSFWDENARGIIDMKNPEKSGKKSVSHNLLSFYHISQKLGTCKQYLVDYDEQNESVNVKKLIETMKKSAYPVIVRFAPYNNQKWGHVVVAYDLIEKSTGGYTIKIWDPNHVEQEVRLDIEADTYKTDWYMEDGTEYGWETQDDDIFIQSCLTYEESEKTYNFVDIEEYIKKKGLTAVEAISTCPIDKKEESISTQSINKQQLVKKKETEIEQQDMSLITNYTEFILTCSNGDYVIIEDGKKKEGNIKISSAIYYNSPNEECEVEYLLPTLGAGESYSVLPIVKNTEETENEEYVSVLRCGGNKGFYARLIAETPVYLTVEQNGDVTTTSTNGEKVEQIVESCVNDTKIEWLSTNIKGKDTGFQLKNINGTTEVYPNNETGVDVYIQETGKYLACGEVPVQDGSISVGKQEDKYTISDSEGTVLVEKEMGSNVYFETGTDMEVETYRNILKNTLIDEPDNISRQGYILEGWYTSATYEESKKWDFKTDRVNEDVCLYAKWEKKTNAGNNPIVVKQVTKVKVKKIASKKAKVTWKKQKGVTGYQVIYSTTKKFTKAKIKYVTVSGGKSNVTLKKLKKGKTYYVKVRAYKKNGNSKLYGKYSVVKKIKMKA